MRLFLLAAALLVASANAQIHTVAGPDGYKYPKPQSQFKMPEIKCQADYLPPPLPDVSISKEEDDIDIRIDDKPAAPVIPPMPIPPPLPDFIPPINLPKIIPLPTPAAKKQPPAVTTKSPNEYLPPFDVRSGFLPTWDEWKIKYGKSYPTKEEDDRRRVIYEDNMGIVIAANKDFELGMSAFDTDVNKYADMTSEEFVDSQCGLRRNERSIEPGMSMMNLFMPSPMLEEMAEDEIDWRKKGAVTPVKNQGKCASCWAFSAAGALESHNFLRNGMLVPLSEQHLIDCVKDNNGCLGGYMTNAFEYVRRNPGIAKEESYPYEADNTTCRFDPSTVGSNVMTYMEIMPGSEVALRQAVATVGPVSAGIDGSRKSFQFYKSGVYYDPKCDQDVNHAVLIVGYGKTKAGEEYWIAKNSWDEDWGESGYIRVARNRRNHCGIASLASYPLI